MHFTTAFTLLALVSTSLARITSISAPKGAIKAGKHFELTFNVRRPSSSLTTGRLAYRVPPDRELLTELGRLLRRRGHSTLR